MEQLEPGTGVGAINSEIVRTTVNDFVAIKSVDGATTFMYNGNPLETTTITSGTGMTTYVNYGDADFDPKEEDDLWNS